MKLVPTLTASFRDAMQNAFSPLANGEITLGSPDISAKLAEVNVSLEGIREAIATQKPVPPEITVEIGTAVTPDNESMTWLADAVADKISPVVEQAIGGDSNRY